MSPPSKVCAVCGDKALGYNFNAVTCESCKAFFRRNALAKKQFTCPFNQNCEITVVTRRFCQKCRLKKCLDIGMKSENIMSEEDKMIKRRKIETNRAKRKLTERKQTEHDEDDATGDGGVVVTREHEDGEGDISAAADSSGYDAAFGGNFDSRSCGSYDSSAGTCSVTVSANASSSNLSTSDYMSDVNPELMTGDEMVEFIVCDPDRASQAISKLMRTPAEALSSLEKIINSQKDALRLISHLINYPGDALKIISKIMNSPFNALTVFTKFMSSPTDALEIISKVVSSPQDVLQFIKNLMDSPEDGMDIMNKFINTPAEALRMLNRILNGPSDDTEQTGSVVAGEIEKSPMAEPEPLPMTEKIDCLATVLTPNSDTISSPLTNENTLIHSMLNYPSPNDINSSVLPPITSPSSNATLSMDSSQYNITPPPSSAETLNMVASPLEYHSSPGTTTTSVNSTIISQHQDDQIPSTSNSLLSPSDVDAAAATEFANEHFDIKTFIQNSFPENATGQYTSGDSLNSLESVLTEVIRIEFQAFNNLPPEPRVKQENFNSISCYIPKDNQPFDGTSGHAACIPQQQICSPSSVSLSRDLNETELMKLRELKLASEALYLPVDEDLTVLMSDDRIKPADTHQDSKLLQVINLTAVAIKRLIKMAKKIAAFRDMCQEDQVALLKGGCTEMMIMRSVMTYDDDRNTWKIPHTKEDMSNIRAEVLKLAKGNVYEEHIKFISTFDEKWRMDENIILIMCAIVLFSPTRPRIIHSDVIRLEQNSYYYLLRRYLESVYPGCEAKSAFIKLIQKISDVERLNQFIIGVYLNVNPSQVEPLLREIFDLKNH